MLNYIYLTQAKGQKITLNVGPEISELLGGWRVINWWNKITEQMPLCVLVRWVTNCVADVKNCALKWITMSASVYLINEAVNVLNVTVSLLSHFPLFHIGMRLATLCLHKRSTLKSLDLSNQTESNENIIKSDTIIIIIIKDRIINLR